MAELYLEMEDVVPKKGLKRKQEIQDHIVVRPLPKRRKKIWRWVRYGFEGETSRWRRLSVEIIVPLWIAGGALPGPHTSTSTHAHTHLIWSQQELGDRKPPVSPKYSSWRPPKTTYNMCVCMRQFFIKMTNWIYLLRTLILWCSNQSSRFLSVSDTDPPSKPGPRHPHSAMDPSIPPKFVHSALSLARGVRTWLQE